MQLILDARFNDLDHCVEEVRHWDLDFRLLGKGGFLGSLRQLVSPDILITHARFLSRLDQAGSTPAGFCTFAVPGPHCNGFWWRGRQVGAGDLLVFPETNELRAATLPDFEVYTVSLRLEYLEQLYDSLQLRCGIPQEVLHMDNDTAREVWSLAATIMDSLSGPEQLAEARLLAEKLAAVTSVGQLGKPLSRRRRDLAVDRVIEYVRHTQSPAFDMDTLCRIAGTSERTLLYAFKERYGISPHVFVKRWNLNSARRLLLQSNPTASTVTEIASSLGFQHQGEFAADYKKLFNELPSTTLMP